MKDTALPIHVLYPAVRNDYQNDYEEIRRLLAAPSCVALGLGMLETDIQSVRGDDVALDDSYVNESGAIVRFDRLEVALLRMERRFGFSSVIRIAPAGTPFHDPNYGSNRVGFEEWTTLLQDGHPLRDYGASRPHGEITHRIQWYVICAAYMNGDMTFKRTGNVVLDLYRAATLPQHRRLYHRPSDHVEYMKSVWSDLFDYGLTKTIDGRSTIWMQRELLFCDWRNYYPGLSEALRDRFVARGGSLDPWHADNAQFFNGSALPTRPPVLGG